MKSILFDVDGVFLSEERCFDVSALTVYELFYGEQFMNLNTNVDLTTLTDEQIANIRALIFNDDQILNRLKSLGLNSNWDMLFIVFSIYLIDMLKDAEHTTVNELLNDASFSTKNLIHIGRLLENNTSINNALPLALLDHVEDGKDNIYQAVEQFAADQLHLQDTTIFQMKSKLWYLAQEVYQEWYLGSTLYSEVEQKEAKTSFKQGFIYQEVVLRPIEEIKKVLQSLKEAGYQLGIATGRPYTETVVPFKSLGLWEYFDEKHVATASDVLSAEVLYSDYRPLGKPNPFSYITALKGNTPSNYEEYIQNQQNLVSKDKVYIVGDSLADLISAQTIGATFIGTLTGLKGQRARQELEAHQADYIVDHVGNIDNILLRD